MSTISDTLEKELSTALRQYGIVVWLDRDGHYSQFVDELTTRHAGGQFFAPVVGFRGSYIQTILSLARYGNGLDPEPLLIHMPGHNEESIRKTPLLELYRAGRRFRKALDTLIGEVAHGKVPAEELETFLSSGEVTLERAELWLGNQIAGKAGVGLAAELALYSPEQMLDGLFGKPSTLQDKLSSAEDAQTLLKHLNLHVGVDEEFCNFYLGGEPLSELNVSEVFAAWIMCVEYVHDLRRQPYVEDLQRLSRLAKPYVETSRALVERFRINHPVAYAPLADTVENHLQAEFDQVRPEDLGKIDTFRTEEARILEGALEELQEGNYRQALQWAESRDKISSFWLAQDHRRRFVWTLVHKGARLGHLLGLIDPELKGLATLDDAIAFYTSQGYLADQAHRQYEQERFRLLTSELPYFSQLLSISDDLRKGYRKWADTLAMSFTRLCKQQGFLPSARFQQRHLFEQVVDPLFKQASRTGSNQRRVAYFVVDAFRYEMASELVQSIQGSEAQIQLDARLSELPSITSVGMNVLAPVQQGGVLTFAGTKPLKGFKKGEYAVNSVDTRVRSMGERSLGDSDSANVLKLMEVCDTDPETLKRKLKATRLLVVHSREVDKSGEAEVGLPTFDSWIQQIRSAWHHLKLAGFTAFVITADHGFLLQDNTTHIQPYGKPGSASWRYIVDEYPRVEENMISVSFKSLDYQGFDGYLLVRTDTAMYDTGQTRPNYVHGGNSLQERVIPVLTILHERQVARSEAQYVIEAKRETPLLGLNRLRIRVIPAANSQSVLSFVGAKHIDVDLRVPGREDVKTIVKDVVGAGLTNQRVRIEVEADSAEIVFALEGAEDERVEVEVYHPDATLQVEPARVEGFFDVVGKGKTVRKAPPDSTGASRDEQEWAERIEDEGVRKVFIHLQSHGSISESEMNHLLGSPRRVRRFAADFDNYKERVPFTVHVEMTPTGKRYVRG